MTDLDAKLRRACSRWHDAAYLLVAAALDLAMLALERAAVAVRSYVKGNGQP